jgi:hypothetical protein
MIISFVPAFEIGIWNAWIFMLILYAAAFVPLSINSKKSGKEDGRGAHWR